MILPERVLGSPGAHWIRSGEQSGQCLTDPTAQLHSQLFAGLFPGHQRDIGSKCPALDVMWVTDDRRFGDLGDVPQARFRPRPCPCGGPRR